MSRVKYYLFLLSIQIVFAIIVYVSLSSVPPEETHIATENEKSQQVFWSYEEEIGPQEWVSVDPSYYACGGGYEQSPINIEGSSIINKNILENINFDYKPTKFLIENDGKSIEVQDPTRKNTLTIDGEVFKLIEINFHTPSEHQLNGQHYNMDGHLVHENKQGKLAIVGFFIKEGKVNTDLADMWSILTTEVTVKAIEVDYSIDLSEVLPLESDTYMYRGSLTTPPCTEGVIWLVLEEPIEMSSQQIEAFADIYIENNRPIQQLNNRKIYKIGLEKLNNNN